MRSNDEFWTDGAIPWLKTEQLGEKYIFDTNEHITEKALQEANVKIFPENTLSETFAKFLFPRQPKPKHRFSAVFVSKIH